MNTFTQEEIRSIREYLYPGGELMSKRLQAFSLKKRFPKIFEEFGTDFMDALYELLNPGMDHTCLGCGNPTPLRSFSKGWQTTCSKKCLGKAQSSNSEFADKIRKTKIEKFSSDYYFRKYGFNVQRHDSNFIIKDQCPNGDITMHSNLFNRKLKTGRPIICELCTCEKRETDIDTMSNLKALKKSTYKFKLTSEEWLMQNHPALHSTIMQWSETIPNLEFKTRVHMYENQIAQLPICPVCEVRPVSVNRTYLNFNLTCNAVSCRNSSSQFERDIRSYVESIYDGEIISNYKMNSHELDIYLPQLKIGIEANGLYWHSDSIRVNPNYHKDKVDFFESLGIQVIQIWEDTWARKRNIVESVIKSKIGRIENRIYARKCSIVILSEMEYQTFMETNHLQSWSVAKVKIGLKFNDDVVAVASFGKPRKILNDSNDTGKWELVRYSSKLNTTVVGGLSKLLKYFIREYSPKIIVSYADRDISNGRSYETVGFKLIHYTTPGYTWMVNRIRMHRSNFMKHKISDDNNKHLTEEQIMTSRGHAKIFDSGNRKYELRLI